MEQTSETRITDLEIAAANKHAKRLLAHNDLVDESLERLTTFYSAARNAGVNEPDALEIGSGLLRGSVRPIPVQAYSIEDFLESVDKNQVPESISGVHEFLKSRKKAPPRIRIGSQLYERNPAPQEVERLIGLDEQYKVLEKHLFQLCSWNPHYLHQDVQKIEWTPGVLLHGPPGTGKTTFCKYARSYVQTQLQKAGVSLHVESLQSTDYDMYVGESEKNLKRKLDRISDPSGVGLLILEEVDMLTENRSNNASSARMGVTNTLMQSLSGFDESPYNNFLVIGTSNFVDNLDPAMNRRLSKKLIIPGFSNIDQYHSLTSRSLSWASDDIITYVSKQGFDRSLSPALMKDYCTYLSSQRLQDLDTSLFLLPLNERTEAFKDIYVDLSLPDVITATNNYSF